MLIFFNLTNGHYAFSERAFARRCMNLLDARNITTIAGGQTALSNMAFAGGGWTNLKKVIAELVLGSIAFPSDLNTDGSGLVPGMTEDILGTRDVSSAVT